MTRLLISALPRSEFRLRRRIWQHTGIQLIMVAVRGENTVITDAHSQESLAQAYIHAIAGHLGLACSIREFDYGIDLTLHQISVRTTDRKRYVESGMPLDVQVKSTTTAIIRGDCLAYDLNIENYDDLRTTRVCTPRILVVHVQPPARHERLTLSEDGLLIRGCCYWISLRGFPPTNNRSRIRIRIPVRQHFSQEGLREILRRIQTGDSP